MRHNPNKPALAMFSLALACASQTASAQIINPGYVTWQSDQVLTGTVTAPTPSAPPLTPVQIGGATCNLGSPVAMATPYSIVPLPASVKAFGSANVLSAPSVLKNYTNATALSGTATFPPNTLVLSPKVNRCAAVRFTANYTGSYTIRVHARGAYPNGTNPTGGVGGGDGTYVFVRRGNTNLFLPIRTHSPLGGTTRTATVLLSAGETIDVAASVGAGTNAIDDLTIVDFLIDRDTHPFGTLVLQCYGNLPSVTTRPAQRYFWKAANASIAPVDAVQSVWGQIPNAPHVNGWLAPPTINNGYNSYTYEVKFFIEPCANGSKISGQFLADDNGYVTVNYSPVGTTPNPGWTSSAATSFQYNVPANMPGLYTVQFHVSSANSTIGLSAYVGAQRQ